MKILLSHPTGNANVRAVLSALVKANALAEFNTTLATNPDAGWLKLLPGSLRSELLRRTFPAPQAQIQTHPLREIARMAFPKLGLNQLVRHEQGWASIDAVYQDFDRLTAQRLAKLATSQAVNAVYAYEDGALETFRQAKKLNLTCVYDLPIAYWETGRSLMLEEADRMPAWAPTLGGGIQDSEAKLERKTRELELADIVVGPGRFVMDSIPGWAADKQTIMAPFGSPVLPAANQPKTNDATGRRPLRVLFAGSMGQRKGLGDLFEAVKLLNHPDLELVVMGSLLSPMEFYRSQYAGFTYEPGRPHDQVLALMRSCDVFCLPSIVEGRALVMQEAMSQGLPLIITPNTGGADLIKEGKTGFLVPIRSPKAIAEKLSWFLDNRDQIPAMGAMAQAHASTYTWDGYGKTVVDSIDNFYSKQVRKPQIAANA
ncbi:glycosyltransferase family 4 protein [Spirosoma linguale]|uniref:Glycosyl transferase group 1 n=1 Tax=Spirosoma linguale (strain ATCC 33905 / DSM 74 / LMG 10896 / Claus 1) TaxID=504472 RepID=D2QTX8_SPILD|nr:glycosyl transferase group 1 [Spirosoma linguale DSM 74]